MTDEKTKEFDREAWYERDDVCVYTFIKDVLLSFDIERLRTYKATRDLESYLMIGRKGDS